jgi:hypothetical protein
MAAAMAMILAVFAGSTNAGVDRARYAALQLREVVMPSGVKPARPLDAIEGRKLAETVRVLTDDRQRLLARIAALEHNVDDITSSISSVERTTRPTPLAEPSPPPMMSAVPQTAAPTRFSDKPSEKPSEDDVASSTGRPDALSSEIDTQSVTVRVPPNAAANPVTKRQFGLDLGAAASEDALKPIWANALRRHNPLVHNLRPVVLTRENPRGGTEYRLIAGPITNAEKAARFCAAITATGGACQVSMYEGQKLATR